MKADELERRGGTAAQRQKQEEFVISGNGSPFLCWLYNVVAPKVKYDSGRNTVALLHYCTTSTGFSLPVPVSLPPDSLEQIRKVEESGSQHKT